MFLKRSFARPRDLGAIEFNSAQVSEGFEVLKALVADFDVPEYKSSQVSEGL